MGMYTYVSLRVWVHEEKRPANRDETRKIIQALYDDAQSNSHHEAEYAFNLDGNSENEVKWYSLEKDMLNFSQKYPEYSFIVQEEGTGEFEGSYNFNTYFQGNSYQYDQYFYLLDFIDFDYYVEDLFNKNFTLFNNINEIKENLIIKQNDKTLKIYIPTVTEQQSDRVHRILEFQAQKDFSKLGINVSKYHNDEPSNSILIEYYLQNCTDNQTTQDIISNCYEITERFLIGEVR